MGIIIDIILVLLLFLSIYLGYRKGLAKVMLTIFSFFIALMLMLILYKPVSNFVIENTKLDEDLRYEISQRLKSSNNGTEENVELKDNNQYPTVVTDFVKKYVDEAIKEGKDNVIDYVSEKLSTVVVNVIVAIGLYITINIALILIGFLLKFAVKLPGLKQIDKSGGILYGIIRGLFLAYIVLAIISISSAFINEQGLLDAIKSSYITKYLYDNNIILKLIVK